MEQLNFLILEMSLNCPKISAAGFFDIGINLIPMVNSVHQKKNQQSRYETG